MSPSVPTGQGGLREAERSGHSGLALNSRGPFHFWSPGSSLLRKLSGFDFSHFLR